MALDPMQEKEQNALRRKTADTLHALARKIENGTYEAVTIEIENELDRTEIPGQPFRPAENRFTGRQTLRILYDTRQPEKKW